MIGQQSASGPELVEKLLRGPRTAVKADGMERWGHSSSRAVPS